MWNCFVWNDLFVYSFLFTVRFLHVKSVAFYNKNDITNSLHSIEIRYRYRTAFMTTGLDPLMLIVLFLVSHFNFLFVPCGGLSWLPISFLLHVKYTLSYCIVTIFPRILTLLKMVEMWTSNVVEFDLCHVANYN